MSILETAPELRALGLSTSVVVARGIDNTRTSPELIAYRRAAARRLASHWRNRSVSAHPALAAYHELHDRFGVVDEPAAPEKLITFVRRSRDFTAAGAVVDCYNVVSTRTLLSIGAHDLAKLALPVTLRVCGPDDRYVPLGGTEPRSCDGEYGYVDARGRVICRLEVLQGAETPVESDSTEVAFFLQANAAIPASTLLQGSWLLAEMIERFCGGRAELAAFDDGAGSA